MVVALEPLVTKEARSWDSIPDADAARFISEGGAAIAPGPLPPLSADLLRRVDYLGIAELRQRLTLESTFPLFEPPAPNYLGVFGGHLAIDQDWFDALAATWEGEGDAVAIRRRVHSSFWPQCAAAIDRNNEKVTASGEKVNAAEIAKATTPILWQRLESLVTMQAHLWANYLGLTAAAAEYATLTTDLLTTELRDAFEPSMLVALTAGLSEIETGRLDAELWKVGRLVASSPALLGAFETVDSGQLAAWIDAPPDAEWRAFARRLREFLSVHGYLCEQGAAPSAPGWHEELAPLVTAIRAAAIASPELDPAARATGRQHTRQQAEAELANRVSRPKRREFLRTAGLAQHYLRSRERTRASWVRAMRLSRPVLLELGARTARQNVLALPAGIFYLSWAEVEAFAHGSTNSMQAGVDSRKREDG